VALTIETELRKHAEAPDVVRRYVLHSGTTRRTAVGATQSLVLSSTRDPHDEEGNRSSLKTNPDQPRPGR
jgi:hypothetical protein